MEKFFGEEVCKKHHVSKIIVHAHSAGIDVTDTGKRNMEERLHEKVKQMFHEDIATDFWACSKVAAEFMFGGRIPKKKIKIMPNAIELDRFSFRQEVRDKYRREHKLENCFVIGHVGRFDYQKNHDFLIEVFYDLVREKEDVRLVLLGDGPLLYQIKEKVKRFGIDEKVLFLGKRDDVHNWYQAMDIFCLPSCFEGLPISMVEAQAAGLPCIGSKNITNEVKICEGVYLLPLEKGRWVKKIDACLEGKRYDNKKELAKHGYDIETQIKNIEREYRFTGIDY